MKYRLLNNNKIFKAKNPKEVVRFLRKNLSNGFERSNEDFMYGFANRRLLTHHQSIIPTTAEQFVEQLLQFGYLEIVQETSQENNWSAMYFINHLLRVQNISNPFEI